jgi:hypothetical protein
VIALTPAKVKLAVDELTTLSAENAALRDELDDVNASFADTLVDNESMGRVIDADDQLKTAMDEVKHLRAMADPPNASCWPNRANSPRRSAPQNVRSTARGFARPT